ncbi:MULTISPECIES: DUF3556 domain-containing protein [Amycolatopsis]|uniref:Transmembrane protein n=1 Tax=Amycolatopsis methanolica 239 TaxID=1068978 RepID=A0A076N5T7_AMYME|nr:DUF3556 domain-containing protein [Amycolatopsis methanolica]AIJ26180.1 hypothetical protein AMETH_6088 [Amycolatopsis methanolica 239]
MGFISPLLPDLDLKEWRSRPHLQRIRPLAQHWAENGFGTPYAVYLLYVVKLVGYVLGAIAVISATPGLGSVGDFGSWWTEPIVYQKVVVWTLLYEVLGFGCGSMPLTFRFLPPIGGFLYWLRPGTVRLPPWPDKVPLTRGTRRSIVDVALYLVVIASAVWLLCSPGTADSVPPGNTVGLLDPVRIIPLVVALPLLGLRDKTIFLAARGEQYWLTLLVFFFPYLDMMVGLKLIMVGLWWGAATSKLNRHFPFVVAVMISNSPLQRVKWIKRKLYRDFPHDLRPSKLSGFAAHTGTVIEYLLPPVLFFSHGGIVTTVVLTIMVIFHLHILSTFPMGVPLEWNIFFIFSALFLFGHYAEIGLSDFGSPLLAALLLVCLVGLPVLGNMKPHLVSFLPSMRYYAGNWATSLWVFRKGSEQKLTKHIVTAAATPKEQLTKLYGEEKAELMLQKAMAWRSMHSHGRALNGLLCRAVDNLDDYDVREGEFAAGMVLGWNFGEGHLHNQQLIDAVQQRCNFAPGELRVIMLESQPIQRQRQHYRIVDAATGQLEEGYVAVKDMVTRQPWLDDQDPSIPVQVLRRTPWQRDRRGAPAHD